MWNKKERCYNGGPRHKFEARYNTTKTPPESINQVQGSWGAVESFIEHMTKRTSTYVCDVCVWCGEVRNAQKT